MSADNKAVTEPRRLVHTAYFPVRWGDMDALGHVNNAVYLTYFDEARIEWWAQHKNAFIPNMKQGPVIAEAGCKFLRPIKYPSNLMIKVYASVPGRSSFTVYYEVFNADDKTTLYATGFTVVVWVDYAHGKSVELSDEMRGYLNPNI